MGDAGCISSNLIPILCRPVSREPRVTMFEDDNGSPIALAFKPINPGHYAFIAPDSPVEGLYIEMTSAAMVAICFDQETKLASAVSLSPSAPWSPSFEAQLQHINQGRKNAEVAIVLRIGPLDESLPHELRSLHRDREVEYLQQRMDTEVAPLASKLGIKLWFSSIDHFSEPGAVVVRRGVAEITCYLTAPDVLRALRQSAILCSYAHVDGLHMVINTLNTAISAMHSIEVHHTALTLEYDGYNNVFSIRLDPQARKYLKMLRQKEPSHVLKDAAITYNDELFAPGGRATTLGAQRLPAAVIDHFFMLALAELERLREDLCELVSRWYVSELHADSPFFFADCDVCGKEATNFCAACHGVLYCSEEHQKEDWKAHKDWYVWSSSSRERSWRG